MNRRRRYAEPSALLAFVQLCLGTALVVLPLDDLPRAGGDLAMAGVMCLSGVALLALGVRNCRRLWSLASEGGSRRRLVGRLVGALFCASAGAVFLAEGEVPAVTYLAFSVFLLVIAVREARAAGTRAELTSTTSMP